MTRGTDDINGVSDYTNRVDDDGYTAPRDPSLSATSGEPDRSRFVRIGTQNSETTDQTWEQSGTVRVARHGVVDRGDPYSSDSSRRNNRQRTRALSGAKRSRKRVSMLTAVVSFLLVGALGVAIGYFCINPLHNSEGAINKTSFTRGELGTVMATYVYCDKTYPITAEEVITSEFDFEDVKKPDHTYSVPGADQILATVRNKILERLAKEHNVTVSNEEIDAYVRAQTGTSDYDNLATMYRRSPGKIRSIFASMALTEKLSKTLVPSDTLVAPSQPAIPEKDKQDEKTPAYAQYIVGLLGDEWDSARATWARTDGPYHTALASTNFTSDSANYMQAQAAYQVAYQHYKTALEASTKKWDDYLNDLLVKSSIHLRTLGLGLASKGPQDKGKI